MTSRYYTMTDSTGASGFLPTVTFTSSDNVFTSAQRIAQLASIPGSPTGSITGFYEADFSGNITTIDTNAFLSDSKVVVVTINKVTTIGNDAFNGCTALRAITLDCAVDAGGRYLLTSIGTSVFSGCTSLRNLHIPDTVKIIPGGICYACTNLEVAVMGYGCASRDAGNNYVADGTIGSYAFANCSKLSYFVVPETVSSIDNNAFANTSALSLVTILGRPTISTTAFTGAMGSGAIYTFDNSASYVTLTSVTDQTFVPTGATKRAYREITLSATGDLTTAIVTTALTSVSSWWKGKILNGVTAIGTTASPACFRPYAITAAKYTNMIGVSFPSTLNTIRYGAFESWEGTTNSTCNVSAFYIPNSVASFPQLDVNNTASATFQLGNATSRDSSTTKQFVFQSGTSTVALGRNMFVYSSAMAIIAPNVTSFGQECFNQAKNVQLYSFFQKNAYTAATRLDGLTDDAGADAFTWNFNKGVAGYTHYLYIPKQITRITQNAFRGLRDKLYVTAYHNTISTAGVTSAASGLGFQSIIYDGTDGNNARFTGTGPTINLIYNYYDANGLTLSGTSNVANNVLMNVLFPSSVKTIHNRFVNFTNLKSVAVDHGAVQTVTINTEAFKDCTGLNYLYFNNRVKTLGYNVFRNTPLSNSFDLIDAHPLESIYHATFHTDDITCYLKQITIPNSVKYLGSYVVSCASVELKPAFTTLSFENGITFWGDYDNTVGAATFTDTNIASAKYMAIPAYTCLNCKYLTSVSFLNTAMDLSGNPVPAYANGALVRPNTGAPIPTRYNTQILNPLIKSIGYYAFQNCLRLQSIRIPDGVTTVYNEAFRDANSLTYLYLPDSLTTIGGGAFNYTGCVNEFTAGAMSVRMPPNLIDYVVVDTGVGTNGYFNSNNTGAARYFTVSFDNTSNKVTNGVLGRFTSQAVNNYIKYHVVILNGITGIFGGSANSTRAFDNFTSLITLTIADTVTNVGPGAVFNTGITNVFISPTSNLTLIENAAFQECTSLTSFFIPNSVNGIDYNAFYGCTSLATVTYGNNPGLKYIGIQAFYNVPRALTNIFIPSSVVSIGNNAFICNAGVNVLNTVTFGAGSRLRSIGQAALGVINGQSLAPTYLRDLGLPNTIRALVSTQVFRNTFTRSHSTNLVFPSSLEYLSESILYADTGAGLDISNIYIPLSITNDPGPRTHSGYTTSGVGLNVFSASSSKSNSLIYLPSHLSGYTGGGATAFPDVNRARSYYKTLTYSGNTVTTLGLSSGSPTNTTNATTTSQIHADIKEGVTVIGGGTKNITSATGDGSLNLISVNIPSTVTTITANAFNGCSAMAYVTFSDNSKLTTIGANAFLGCSTIHDIQLPDTVTTIGANAFSGCYNLASISIPYNVTSIGAGAFNINTNTPTNYIARPAARLAYQLGGDIYGEANSDYSGYSVSLSQDGKILAIGAYLNDATGGDAGQVRVYKYQTITDSTWVNYTAGSFFQNGTSPYNKPIVVNGGDAIPVSGKSYWVQLGSDINGEAAGDNSGFSVSLSSDGTTVAIGTTINTGGGTAAGQVRVYKYQTITDASWNSYTINSFSQTGTSPFNKPIVVNGGDTSSIFGKFYWAQLGSDINGEAANIQSGWSVSLSSNGTIVAIGAPGDDAPTTNAGGARVYQYSTGTGTWSKIGTFNGGATLNDNFGNSVAISDDGTVLAVGASHFDTGGVGNDTGNVRIYKYSTGTTWTQRGSTITGAAGDYSGESVSLNGDGTIVAIGAHNSNGGTGQVSVYKYNGTAWIQYGQNINGLAGLDYFGTSVSLSSDGTVLAVGSPYSDDGVVFDAGLARIYKYIGGTWQQLGQDIRGYYFSDLTGRSVSLSKDGTTVAIGVHGNDINGNDSGAVEVYQLDQFTVPIRLHQRLYNDISGSLSTYFPGINTSAIQVIPALTLTNTLNPAKLTISQINNMYIRYRQSQIGFCTFITVSATGVGGSLTASDITAALSSSTGLVHLDISTNVTSIDANVCNSNKRIYSVAISKTVTSVGNDAFSGCTNLSYLSFHPDSVCTNLASLSFHNTNIYDLALPDSLTTIGVNAFQSSMRLTSACIPKNVADLSASFLNCQNLTAVALPNWLATYSNANYFNTNGNRATGADGKITFTYYSATSTSSAIPHFKLSDYSMPSGIVQTVIDSAVTYIDHRAYAYYPDITLYAITTYNQMETPGDYTYTVNNVKMPIMPAAFAVNGSFSGGTSSNYTFPLYSSVPDLNVFSLDATTTNWPENTDDFYILMPGYSICIYNNLYDEENLFTDSPLYRYYDNEFGTFPMNVTLLSAVKEKTSSILIMYNGLILSKYFIT